MEQKQVLELNNHRVFYIKTDVINYFITIPKNITETRICLELKTKMDNYNPETNDEIWVMENVKSTFSYIDNYNITLVLPILNEQCIDILEKLDNTKFENIDRLLGYTINSAYNQLKASNINIEPQILLVNNERYKTFINWFTTRYKERVVCKNLLQIIQLYNVNATTYKKLETPQMTFVVGSYGDEVNAPKSIKYEEEKPNVIPANLAPQTSSGFSSYWLLVTITIIVAGIVAFLAFTMK